MGRFDDCKPIIAMVALQSFYAGVALFSRAALVQGMNPRVYIVYRQGIATLIMAPLAFFSIRKRKSTASLGLKCFAWIFLASLIGSSAYQNAYFEGLFLTSSTAASAMVNLAPAVTFLIATILGLEKINIRSLKSIAKIIGTIICVSGAISMALLKGPKLLNLKLLPPTSFLSSEGNNWLLGCILLFGSSCFWSIWLFLLVPISASCPDHLYSSAWMSLLATIESIIIAFLSENDVAAWNLNSYLEISCCLYAGIGQAMAFFLQAWCISQRGPLFSAMFNPLCTVITASIAALFMHEETHLGSLIGALAVMSGLYVVLWGKAKDLEEVKKHAHLKLQNDDSRIVQVIVDDESLENKNCNADLQEPLLSHKSAHFDENNAIP